MEDFPDKSILQSSRCTMHNAHPGQHSSSVSKMSSTCILIEDFSEKSIFQSSRCAMHTAQCTAQASTLLSEQHKK